jgi:hypothetical protein
LFNASFGIYHPYQDKLEVITFPGITNNGVQHVGGVGWDKYTGLVSVLINAGAAFNTAGADVSGDNIIKKYNPFTKQFVWSINLTDITQGAWGGFNDVTTDIFGNTYIVGTFPGTITRVDRKGTKAVPWYLPPVIDHRVRGYAGIASTGDTVLAMDSSIGQLYRFDASAAQGTPVLVPHTPNTTISGSDAIHLPLKYAGKVMLVAEHVNGVTVLRSKDGRWLSCEHLGTIPNAVGLPSGALVVSTTQIGNSLYMINDWLFGDPIVPGTNAGNKTSFPMIDITAQVEALLH